MKNFVNCYSTELGITIIQSLCEFVQGPCKLNQATLVQCKTIDCCRDLLSQGQSNEVDMQKRGFIGARKENLNELKDSSVGLLLAIIEGQTEEGIYERVAESLGNFIIVT